jgi:multicomponent Na+:H+ antiporter subunit F
MSEFFMGAAVLVLLLTAVGLLRLLRGPGQVDRLMSAQLFGTSGVAVLLLLAAAGESAAIDVALLLALLSAFVSLAFVLFGEQAGASSAVAGGDE